MADTSTPNYALTKPEDGASNDTWGTKTNANWDTLDTAVKAVSDVADAALPKAGGAMTGRMDALTSTLARSDMGTGNGAKSLNCAVAQWFKFTANGNTSFSFLNVPAPAGTAFGVIVELTNGGAYVITWPASVKWQNGAAPALTAAGKDILVLMTSDGGTTWFAAMSMKDVR
jgi:hypothetical protein